MHRVVVTKHKVQHMLQRVFSCKQKHCIEQVTGIWERVRNGYQKCKSKMDRQDNTTSK